MKRGNKVLFIDDGPVDFDEELTTVAGVLASPDAVAKVFLDRVEIDGTDATDVVVRMVGRARDPSLAMVMMDGISLGGFNVVDIRAVHGRTGVPACTFTRGPPDLEAMDRVLEERFGPGSAQRLALKDARPVSVGRGDVHANLAGLGMREFAEALDLFTPRGLTPHPLTLAHRIAGEVLRFTTEDI